MLQACWCYLCQLGAYIHAVRKLLVMLGEEVFRQIRRARPPATTESNQKCTIDLLV